MFNWSNIPERQLAGEFQVIHKDSKNVSKKTNHPKDTRSRWSTFRDNNGDEIATAHHYICPSGPVTPIDPKALKIGDMRYVIHPNDLVANPEHKLPATWMMKVYGFVMKLKCAVFGPIAVLP